MQTFAVLLLIAGFLSFCLSVYGMITDNIDFEPCGFLLFGGTGVMFVACVIGMVSALDTEHAEYGRLLSQCLADGKKEYECVSLLRKPESTVATIPVIIPIR